MHYRAIVLVFSLSMEVDDTVSPPQEDLFLGSYGDTAFKKFKKLLLLGCNFN